MVRIGRYTAALSLTALGILLLLDHQGMIDVFAVLKAWWPAVIVALGIEVLLVQAFNREPGVRTRVSFGTLLGALVLGGVVLVVTRGNDIGFSRLHKWTDGISAAWHDSDNAKHSFRKDVIKVAVPASGKKIAITDTNGHVKLTRGLVNEIEIQAVVYVDIDDRSQAEEIARKSAVSVKEGDTIEIAAEPKSYGAGNMRKPRIDLTVTFPQGQMPGSVSVDVTNGSVRADQVTGTHELVIDVKNGEIAGQNISVDLRANVLNGDIELTDLKGGANVETVNGDILVRDVFGSVSTTTVNGDIDIRSTAVGGDWKASSTMGDVELAWPDGMDVDVNADSLFGDVDTDWPLRVTDHEAAGKLGEGTWKVTVETNADISLQKFEP